MGPQKRASFTHTYTHNAWKHWAVRLLEEALVSLTSLIKCLCLSDILGIQTLCESKQCTWLTFLQG